MALLAEMATSEETSLRVCRLTLLGLLAGYFLMFDDWIQLFWLGLTVPFVFMFAPWSQIWPTLTKDRFMRLAAHFLSWMTFTSVLSHNFSSVGTAREISAWMFGAVLLVIFSLWVWIAAVDLKALHKGGWWLGMGAAFAAVISMIMFYLVLPGHVFGERLGNWFVYGGLNPVATGLTMGFAGMWLACVYVDMPKGMERKIAFAGLLILLAAVFFTRSRGAVLALSVGHVCLLYLLGWKKCRTPVLLLASVALVFQLTGPLISSVTTKELAMMEASEITPAVDVSAHRAYSNPVKELILRGDNGRFVLYQAALGALHGPRQWIMGVGQWSTEHLWKPCISWNPEHMHSAFLATLVHGGVIGLGLLLAAVMMGMRRGWYLARAGHTTWLILLCFGVAGMMFDGQTMTRFTSLPRMEVLLVTFPLMVIAAGYHQIRRDGRLKEP